MPTTVDIPEIGTVEFPDAMSEQDISEEVGKLTNQRAAPSVEPSGILRRYVADPAIGLAKGIVGLPEAIVGLADIPTLGYAGKILEAGGYGFQPKVTKDYLSSFYSPEQQAANAEVHKAKGFFPTVKAMVENPSTIADTVLESLPSMMGGAGAARKLISVAPKLAPLVAGAIGEGAVTAGQTAEQTRQASEGGLLTPKQAALSATSGAATGLISVLGGKLANRLGITDIDTLLAGGGVTAEAAKKNVLRRVVESAITEGAFEELPQSAQEQIQQNLANNKPALNGVAEASATGLLAGLVMGGVGGIAGGRRGPRVQTGEDEQGKAIYAEPLTEETSDAIPPASPPPSAPALKLSAAQKILKGRGVADDVATAIAESVGQKLPNETGEDYRARVFQAHDNAGFVVPKEATPPFMSLDVVRQAGLREGDSTAEAEQRVELAKAANEAALKAVDAANAKILSGRVVRKPGQPSTAKVPNATTRVEAPMAVGEEKPPGLVQTVSGGTSGEIQRPAAARPAILAPPNAPGVVAVTPAATSEERNEAWRISHMTRGIEKRQDVSAAAVDTYNIKLPEGYVREGDRYIFKPSEINAPNKETGAAAGPQTDVSGGTPAVVKSGLLPTGERIVATAVRTEDGKIFSSANKIHPQLWEEAGVDMGALTEKQIREDNGFLTDSGRFVTSREAESSSAARTYQKQQAVSTPPAAVKPEVKFVQGQQVRAGTIEGSLTIYDDGRIAIRNKMGEFPVDINKVEVLEAAAVKPGEANPVEPWQMTREEFSQNYLDLSNEERASLDRQLNIPPGHRSPNQKAGIPSVRDQLKQKAEKAWYESTEKAQIGGLSVPAENKPYWARTQKQFEAQTGNDKSEHRWHVERAIRENLPVPPEVLADYPDLTPLRAKDAQTDTAGETLRDRLSGKRSATIGTVTSDAGVFNLSVRPDNSAGGLSVVLSNKEGSQSIRMNYRYDMPLADMQKAFQEYLNIDNPGKFKVELSQAKPAPVAKETAPLMPRQLWKRQIMVQQSIRYKTASQEKAIERLKAKLAVDPSKWTVGDGVGYRVNSGRGTQVNRGFRIVDVDRDAETVTVRQVADTGLTSSGGNADRFADAVIDMVDLVRDNKYTRKSTPAAAPAQKPPAPASDVSPKQSAQTEAVKPSVAPTPEPVKRVVRGLKARKVFAAETDMAGPDILSWIEDNMRMLSKSAAKAKGEAWFKSNQSDWDDAAPLARPHHNVIYGGTSTPNQVAQAAFDAGVLKESGVNALWSAIKTASARRSNAFKESKAQEAQMQRDIAEQEAWQKATAKGEIRISADQLKVGDVMDVEGERVEVTDVNPETGAVTLKDGRKFDRQILREGQSIFVEKFEPSEVSEEFVPSKGGELGGEISQTFNLVGEKAKFVEPTKQQTVFGEETLSQNDLFQIEQVTKEVDPFKSADAAQRMYGGPVEAAKIVERQLRTLDQNPEFKKQFDKKQRARLSEVLNLLRERASKPTPQETGGTIKTGIEGGTNEERTEQADSGTQEARAARMAQDLEASGQVLRATIAEISQLFSDANRLAESDRQSAQGQSGSGVGRDIRSVTPEAAPGVFETTRVFVAAEPAEGALVRTRMQNANLLAHRILFGAADSKSADFIFRLTRRLPGLKFVFRDFGEGTDNHANYYAGKNSATDFISVNLRMLETYDLSKPESIALWDAALVEEILHAASTRLSSTAEIAALGKSLTSEERAAVKRAYDSDNKLGALDDFTYGHEYVRMILQDRLTGETTERHFPQWRASEALKTVLRNLVNWLKQQFGAKPDNDIARQVIDRIEGAIRGDADIQGSVFGESAQTLQTGLSREPTGDARAREEEVRGSVIDPATGEWMEAAEGAGDIVQIAGIEYNIIGKERLTPEQKAAAVGRVQDYFGKELNLPGAPDLSDGKLRGSTDTNLVFKVVPDGENHDAAGERLLSHLIEQIQSQHQPGGNPAYVSSLVNALNKNFNVGNLQGVFSDGMIQRLMEISVGESSWRGTMLRAVTGITDDMATVARNARFFLRRTYENMFGGDLARKLMDRIALNFRERFTGEEIERLYNENPILQELFLKVVSRLQVKPSLRDVIAEIFATRIDRQDDIVEKFVNTMVDKFSATPDEAARLKSEFSRTFEASFKAAREKAQAKALASLLPEERKAVGAQTPLWRKLTDLVNSGWFDSAKAVEEYARSKGMKVPTDAEIKKMRNWSIKEQSLREPTAAEVKQYGDKAGILVQGTTLEERQDLLRKMNTQWSRWTHPVASLRRPSSFLDPTQRYNFAMAANEWLTANLLLKLGFGSRQIIDVGTQMVLHTPTRAASYAFEQWGNDKSAGRDANLLDALSTSITDAYRTRLKVLGDTLASFKRTLAGKGEQKNVEQLISSIAVFDRALLKADEMKAQGRPAAARFLQLLALTMRFGRQFAAAADVIQGVPAEAQEMAHQIRLGLREQGKSAGQQELEFNTILGLLTTARVESLSEARQILEARGMDTSNSVIQRAAWHILREKIYSMAKTAGLPADEWKAKNHYFRNVIGWNEPETQGFGGIGGPGGLVAMGAKAGKELVSKTGFPAFPFVFGNAMGISLNRKLAYTPLGLFPGFFKGSPWFTGETNIRQRKIEAIIGTTIGSTLFGLAALGILVVLPRKWPDDEKEKAKWTANGWQPGMVIIPVSDTQEMKISARVGPMSLLSPYLAAGGAFRDSLADREKKQQVLNERAEKLGLTPEKLEGFDAGQWLNVIGSAAYASAVGGRTSSGMLGSYTDFGQFSAKKSGASATSTLIPGLPGFQEISRMAGANINPKLASFWDLLVPLPTSDANRVNLLGDPMRNENDVERIFQVLTGGTSLIPADKQQFNKNKAYTNLFASDFRPPSINPSRGYQFGNELRPMSESELQRYTTARGKQFSTELQSVDVTGLSPKEAKAVVQGAFQRANAAALSEVGASSPSAARAGTGSSSDRITAAPSGVGAGPRRTGLARLAASRVGGGSRIARPRFASLRGLGRPTRRRRSIVGRLGRVRRPRGLSRPRMPRPRRLGRRRRNLAFV